MTPGTYPPPPIFTVVQPVEGATDVPDETEELLAPPDVVPLDEVAVDEETPDPPPPPPPPQEISNNETSATQNLP